MASKFGCCAGKVIQIDLTTEIVMEYLWTDRQRQLYLGGKIMANRILQTILQEQKLPFRRKTG